MNTYGKHNPLLDADLTTQVLHLGYDHLFAMRMQPNVYALSLRDIENRMRMVTFDHQQAEALFRWLGQQLQQPSGQTGPAEALELDQAEFLRPDKAERIEADAPRRDGTWFLRVPLTKAPHDVCDLDRFGTWLDAAGISYVYRAPETSGLALVARDCTNVPANLPDWIEAYQRGA